MSTAGSLKVVGMLIRNKTPLETLNAHGGTILGCVLWSAVRERKPVHLRIIEALPRAGADVRGASYPSGDERVDEVLRRL